VITNEHVIHGRTNISLVMATRQTVPARVLVADIHNDLAVLEIVGPTGPPAGIPLAEDASDSGTEVFTVGHPHVGLMGSELKVTSGIISSTSGLGGDPRFLQMTVPLQSGNSGGPLLNMRGEAVGVTTAKLNAAAVLRATGDLPENVNYAIKAIYVRALLESAGQERPARPLTPGTAPLAELVKRVRGSVVLVLAE